MVAAKTGEADTHPAPLLANLGVGLWTMQSTRARPANPAREYRRFVEDACFAEALGFASIWTAEHRVWYDGWCPALLHAQALAASRTKRIRFGNSMLLAPQHDPTALARAALTLDRLTNGRVDLGVGLGHRDAEFDALGLRRDRRGGLMDAALARFAEVWAGQHGDGAPAQAGGPPVWIGGMAPAAIERAARLGHGLVLPPTLSVAQTRDVIGFYREHAVMAERPAQMGMLRDVHITADAADADAFKRHLRRHYAEEIGSWWVVKGQVGFEQGDAVEKQIDRAEQGALVGRPEDVARSLDDLFAAGLTHIAVRVHFDFTDRAESRRQLRRLALEVAPSLTVPATQ
jgi:alkanesulfonate monooxygenase SsuD/methylene tetrahydromethanopterin reductase-like flavin-dependent oxidoreductase (luciferase family)